MDNKIDKKEEKKVEGVQKKPETTQKKIVKLIKEKALIINAGLLILALILGYGWFSSVNSTETSAKAGNISEEKAKARIMSIVNKGVEIKDVVMENDLYKAALDVNGNDVVAYLSKDGEIFFSNFVNVDEALEKKSQQTQAANKKVPQTEKPEVEVFVMSYCPFGTQVQRGMLPVMETLGDKADIEFKFVDYAMHGKKEADENTRQYCVAQEDPEKYFDYMTCFLKTDDAEGCLESAGVSAAAVTSCEAEVEEEFAINEKLENKSSWGGKYPPYDIHKAENDEYGVSGSPTVVVNGVTVNTKRDPASLLKTVCKGFEDQPEACDAELSSVTPSTKFGEESGTDSNASCN